MEITQKTATVRVFSNGISEAECPIDGDFLLPEYCPDIAAVLKCTLTPAVLSRRQSGDKLLVEGQATLCVLYLDEERRCMHTFEGVLPFGCSISGVESTAALPYVAMRTNYLNCHAVSPRRIDVHGALTAVCHNGNVQKVQVVSAVEGDGVHTRKEKVCYTVPIGTAEKNFSMSEVVDIGSSRPPAKTILRTAYIPTVTSVKAMTDKAVVKGQVQLSVLYTAEGKEETVCQAQYTFPFSQILEVNDLLETHICTAKADVITAEVHVTPDQNGHGTLLAISLKLCVRLDVTTNTEAEILTDAYTSKYPVAATLTQFTAEELLFSKQETTALKEVLDLPSDNMAQIVDLWCEIVSVSVRKEGECTYADGHLQICMPVCDKDGIISYYEHVSDFTLQFEEPCDRMAIEVRVCDVSFAVVGGKIEIRIDLAVCREGYVQKVCRALQELEVSAEPYPEQRAALRICRAQKGASVWEIAKSCHTDVKALMEENNLFEECVPEDCMLMVPLC